MKLYGGCLKGAQRSPKIRKVEHAQSLNLWVSTELSSAAGAAVTIYFFYY